MDGAIADLWAFADALPAGPRITLGAGGTPLVEAPAFDASFKLETCNPTGSFKDRGATLTIARAAALDVASIREDSSGNAGLAIATFAARADIPATIYVPASGGSASRAAIEATGATVKTVDGDRAAVERACLEGEGWYASHAWRPEFYLGTGTLAWELVAETGGAPDAVVLPVGHGTLLLGMYRGFAVLMRAGRIDTLPRLYAAQLDGAGSLLADERPVDPSIAPGVRVRRPARAGQVRAAIDESGGGIVPVDPASIDSSRRALAQRGFDVSSTSVVAVVARCQLAENGTEPPSNDVIVPLTGRSRDR